MALQKLVSNILAENLIATNGQAADRANRPTGTLPHGPYASGEETADSFQSKGF